MKKRTCVIGYTKICQRMEAKLNQAYGNHGLVGQIEAFISNSKKDGRRRHEAANRLDLGMSAAEHSIRKSLHEFAENVKPAE